MASSCRGRWTSTLPLPTRKGNLKKLSGALEDMDAKLRLGTTDQDESLVAPLDERMLTNTYVVTMMTRYGPFDVLFEPPGVPPYV